MGPGRVFCEKGVLTVRRGTSSEGEELGGGGPGERPSYRVEAGRQAEAPAVPPNPEQSLAELSYWATGVPRSEEKCPSSELHPWVGVGGKKALKPPVSSKMFRARCPPGSCGASFQ